MNTIKGFMDKLSNIAKETALNDIYAKLGDQLSEEVKNSTCEFVFDIETRKSHFINCPPELDKKIFKKMNEG